MMFDGYTREYLEHEMSEEEGTRSKRFIVSTPILVGSIIGAASLATACVTAAVVAKSEVQGVIDMEKVHRNQDINNSLFNDRQNLNLTALIAKDIDNIRFTEAISLYAAKSRSDAKSSNDELTFLLSTSGVFEYADPHTEQYHKIIKEANEKYSVGLTREEVKEKTRLSMDITSTYTSAIQIDGSSRKCKDMVLMKTILTPIIDHRNRLHMVSVNGRYIPRYGNHSFYIVMSKSNLISTNQRMFGQNINVVGRLCRIHTSVNASSIPTNDQLSEVFEFRFNGSLKLSETCHHNGSSVTEDRTVFSYAKIKLPLTCNIRSEKINCDSVKFNSNKPEEIHVLQKRMEVIEEHFEEQQVQTLYNPGLSSGNNM